ncbi:WecB/TagA/CpsF family glycosyltransferase, partial [bacterium]|nr:WecB/TagA/CpsF family glycosyltransferase [bacterium]
LVAMGARVQEYWVERIRTVGQVPLLLGIGGSLDALVGATPRAPRLVLNLGLEWMYRLIRQPKRWRVMVALPIFAMQTLQLRLRLRGL